MTFIANIRAIVKVSVFEIVEVTYLTLFRTENTIILNDILSFCSIYTLKFCYGKYYCIKRFYKKRFLFIFLFQSSKVPSCCGPTLNHQWDYFKIINIDLSIIIWRLKFFKLNLSKFKRTTAFYSWYTKTIITCLAFMNSENKYFLIT